MAEDYDWGKLNHLQLGRYAEYFVKMEFTRHGFDVYSAEVDDKGIDLVVRREQRDGGTQSPNDSAQAGKRRSTSL